MERPMSLDSVMQDEGKGVLSGTMKGWHKKWDQEEGKLIL